jgi:hypothetical protein
LVPVQRCLFPVFAAPAVVCVTEIGGCGGQAPAGGSAQDG